MVVAVAGVGVVQVTLHQVIHVVSMGSGLMATPGLMAVGGDVPGAMMLGRTLHGVPSVLQNDALIHMARVLVVQVPVVEVVHVVTVLDGGVATASGVIVGMPVVGLVAHHEPLRKSGPVLVGMQASASKPL
jgi:hypothetical protein